MESIKHPNFYLPLDNILQDVYSKNIKVERRETRKILSVVEKKINRLLEAMKQTDRAFAILFNRTAPTGSFFDKLMIFSPKEFDYNIILSFPFHSSKIKIEKESSQPRFVKLNIENVFSYPGDADPEILRIIRSWTSADGYLQEDKMRSWLEGVINKAKIRTFSGLHEIHLRKSGPAFTISVLVEGGKTVDVDLVLAIEFPSSIRPPTKRPYYSKYPWFVITKSPKKKSFWQMSFPCAEKEILSDKRLLRLVCKLLKTLKENADHIKIASYAIKTLFLEDVTLYRRSWESNLGYLFVLMIERLQSSFKTRHLGYFWDNDLNMYKGYSANTLSAMDNFLNNILSNIHHKLNVNDIAGLKRYMDSLLLKTSR